MNKHLLKIYIGNLFLAYLGTSIFIIAVYVLSLISPENILRLPISILYTFIVSNYMIKTLTKYIDRDLKEVEEIHNAKNSNSIK